MQIDAIVADIQRMYGSLTEPHFGAIAHRLHTEPPTDLLTQLPTLFEVADRTEPNDDHGWRLELSRDAHRWALDLSAVGPYAAFGRLGIGWDEVLTPDSGDLTPEERWVVRHLTAHNLRLLSQHELDSPVPLRLFKTQDVRLYHALFTDTEILPWDHETLRRLGLI